MNAQLGRRMLTSLSAGAIAGVLGATGMAAFAADGGPRPMVVVDDDGCGTAIDAENVDGDRATSRTTWFGAELNALE
ncbi:hypothetical protein ACQE98_10440 [Ornithinimicrobium sp. W1679]|uniref:hypothetical protein n=1 Tax=unclassified Ornithinimicrobium TaxID=2615080 RepID=UPI003CF60725